MRVSELSRGDIIEVSQNGFNRKLVTVAKLGDIFEIEDTEGNTYYEREGASSFSDIDESEMWDVLFVFPKRPVLNTAAEEDVPVQNPVKNPWPPKLGDVWRTRSGAEYHILPQAYSDEIRIEHATEKNYFDHLSLDQLEDMNPALVYRKP